MCTAAEKPPSVHDLLEKLNNCKLTVERAHTIQQAQRAEIDELKNESCELYSQIETAMCTLGDLRDKSAKINKRIADKDAEMHDNNRHKFIMGSLLSEITNSAEFAQFRAKDDYHASIIHSLSEPRSDASANDLYNSDMEIIAHLNLMFGTVLRPVIPTPLVAESSAAPHSPTSSAEQNTPLINDTLVLSLPAQLTYDDASRMPLQYRPAAMQAYLIDTHTRSRFVAINFKGFVALISTHLYLGAASHIPVLADLLGQSPNDYFTPRYYWYCADCTCANEKLMRICTYICTHTTQTTFICGVPNEYVYYNTYNLIIYKWDKKIHMYMNGRIVGMFGLIYKKFIIETESEINSLIEYWKSKDVI